MQILKQLVLALSAMLPSNILLGQFHLESPQIIRLTENENNKPLKSSPNPPAVVLWHGLGDHYDSEGMSHVAELVQQLLPGTFVHSIYVDADLSLDERKSLFGDANAELELVCERLANMTELRHGFDAIGFSQGGLFLRALIQKCPSVIVRKLVTFGSPHMGVLELPVCQPEDDWLCKRRNAILKKQVWQESVQKSIIPAQYFRDMAQYERYLEHLHFLADVNNERGSDFDPQAKERFENLEKLVLIQFSQDNTLVPKESAFFQETSALSGQVVPMTNTRVYRENLFGLRTLHEAQKIDFYTVEGEHMRFTDAFLKQIVTDYFAGHLSP